MRCLRHLSLADPSAHRQDDGLARVAPDPLASAWPDITRDTDVDHAPCPTAKVPSVVQMMPCPSPRPMVLFRSDESLDRSGQHTAAASHRRSAHLVSDNLSRITPQPSPSATPSPASGK